MRSLIDALKLVWPIAGGHRLVWPGWADRTWPLMRRLARWYRRHAIRRTCVVAVVGSAGKTTTRRMVEAALGGKMPPQSASNFGVRLAANVLRVRPWHPYAVLEVGIPGRSWMSRLADVVAPDIVVVTSIGSSHNRTFRTLEETRAEKVAMVRALGPDGLAVLNGDDPHVRWMATQTRARVLTFGLSPGNDVRATDVHMEWPSGTRLTLHSDGQSQAYRSRLLGTHMVYPVLAAATVAIARGVRFEEIAARVESVAPTPRRMEPIPLTSGATILSDVFKAPLETIMAALDTLGAVQAKRRVAVLGEIEECQGSANVAYRDLGARLATRADRVILVGGDNLKSVITGAARAGMPRAALTYVGSSVHEAIALLRRELTAGDVVLIKGPGALRFERVVLALQGRVVRCEVKVCRVRGFIACTACPLLTRERAVFENVHLREMARF
jgi:UDP-N-acetylmuramoyl-tripeptide--D-alanyl-D-alanine ligase